MSIQNLSQGTFSGASQVPFYDPSNGQDRKGSLTELATALEALGATGGSFVQYAAAVASGSTVFVTPFVEGGDTFLLLLPTGTLASLTITLPAASQALADQEVLVHSTNAITSLSVAANGASLVSGAPSSLAAGGFFRLRFDGVYRGWFRIG